MKKITHLLRARAFAWIKYSLLLLATFVVTSTSQAQPDYPSAIWNPAYSGHWYNSGNGHKFVVIHDMEGYYLTTISYFKQSGTQASAHYCVNGLKDDASDAPAGEITQMVRESHYAWHALCWNTHSFGTEHEGFVSNPAWYTDVMYNASAALQRHLCNTWGILKDRNHIVGHNEGQNPTWVSWAGTGLGIDPSCNTHTDPGPFWDWSFFMKLVEGGTFNYSRFIGMTAPDAVAKGATFSASITFTNNGTAPWTLAGGYKLGSQSPQDNSNWGFDRVALPVATVNTNETVTFNFTCTAPNFDAKYQFAWRMVQDGVEWFGATASKEIYVGNAPADIIVDNPAATVVGSWSTGTSAGDKYGADYRYKSGGTGAAWFRFAPNILTAGSYQVFEWHPAGSNRTTGGKVTVSYNGGSQLFSVNQQISGGRWNLLGAFNFATGSAGYVQVADNHSDSANVVMADAFKFVYVPPVTPPAAPSGLTATAVSSSQINLAWSDNSNDENNFIVSRSETAGGPYTDIATLSANTTSYNNTGLIANTTYYYVVRASNSGGSSANSNEASATTQSGPVIVATHVQSITMSWVAAGSKFKARAVVRVVDAAGAPVSGATVTGNFTGNINNPGLTGTTTSTGDATITSTSSIKNGTVTFTVTNITGSNMTYDSAANVVTSQSISR